MKKIILFFLILATAIACTDNSYPGIIGFTSSIKMTMSETDAQTYFPDGLPTFNIKVDGEWYEKEFTKKNDNYTASVSIYCKEAQTKTMFLCLIKDDINISAIINDIPVIPGETTELPFDYIISSVSPD